MQMQILVLIEPVEGGRFRAKAAEPLNVCAEGATAEEAIQKVGSAIRSLLEQGGQITAIAVTNGKVTTPAACPIPADNLFQTDWAYRELQDAIAENRRAEEAANP